MPFSKTLARKVLSFLLVPVLLTVLSSQVIAQQTTTAAADSKLTTLDNPSVNIRVWYSDLHVDAKWIDYPGGSWEAYYNARYDPWATAPNWWRTSAQVRWNPPDQNSGTAVANSKFSGVFPFTFPFILWAGQADHQITINKTTDHRTWLTGSIDAYDVRCQCWGRWKDRHFETGGTYPNNTRQDYSWSVVSSVQPPAP